MIPHCAFCDSELGTYRNGMLVMRRLVLIDRTIFCGAPCARACFSRLDERIAEAVH